MIHMFSRKKVLVSLITCAALAFTGCGNGDDDDDDDDSATPATLRDDFFRVTNFEFGDSSEGLDLDGDGNIDNNIEYTLEAIQVALIDAIQQVLVAAEVNFGDACVPDEPCGDTIMEVVTGIIEENLTVQTLSDAINRPIQEGNVNYIQEFAEEGANVNLLWWKGVFQDTGMAKQGSIGNQPGSLTDGAGLFGPGNLTLSLTFETGGQSGETTQQEIELILYECSTKVPAYNVDELVNFVIGGAISLEDLLAIVENTLNSINDALPSSPIPVSDIMDTLQVTIIEYADINIDSDADLEGFSLALIGDSSKITIVE